MRNLIAMLIAVIVLLGATAGLASPPGCDDNGDDRPSADRDLSDFDFQTAILVVSVMAGGKYISP